MYTVITSTRRFKDPISGKTVKAGDSCLQDADGDLFHIDRLPVRKLVPLKEYLKAKKTA